MAPRGIRSCSACLGKYGKYGKYNVFSACRGRPLRLQGTPTRRQAGVMQRGGEEKEPSTGLRVGWNVGAERSGPLGQEEPQLGAADQVGPVKILHELRPCKCGKYG